MAIVSEVTEYDPHNIADRLHDQKSDVEKLGFALSLLVGYSTEVDNTVHRVNAWIDDAVACLRTMPRVENR